MISSAAILKGRIIFFHILWFAWWLECTEYLLLLLLYNSFAFYAWSRHCLITCCTSRSELWNGKNRKHNAIKLLASFVHERQIPCCTNCTGKLFKMSCASSFKFNWIRKLNKRWIYLLSNRKRKDLLIRSSPKNHQA